MECVLCFCNHVSHIRPLVDFVCSFLKLSNWYSPLEMIFARGKLLLTYLQAVCTSFSNLIVFKSYIMLCYLQWARVRITVSNTHIYLLTLVCRIWTHLQLLVLFVPLRVSLQISNINWLKQSSTKHNLIDIYRFVLNFQVFALVQNQLINIEMIDRGKSFGLSVCCDSKRFFERDNIRVSIWWRNLTISITLSKNTQLICLCKSRFCFDNKRNKMNTLTNIFTLDEPSFLLHCVNGTACRAVIDSSHCVKFALNLRISERR